MLDKIDSILQRDCLLTRDNLLLVGVSGGPDSLTLLHSVHKLGYPITAAHVNHALRPEADQEEQIVKQYAAQLGIDFIACHMDVKSFAGNHSISIEESARILRYRYLFEQAEKIQASAVLVGHNADDQVETILMHLLRGSGLSGLRGMDYFLLPNPWSEHIPLVRPLLSISREEILIYLAENELDFVSDNSNLNTTFFRNRLRHELLPILERFSPNIRENLLRAGIIMRDDYSIIQQLVGDAWDRTLRRQGPGYLEIDLAGYLELSPSIQRYLLRKAIACFLPGLRDVEFDCIERGLGFLSEPKPRGQVDLIAGLCIIKEGDTFWLANGIDALPLSDYAMVQCGVQYTLEIPSTLYLANGWELHAEEAPDPVLAFQLSNTNVDNNQAWLDAGEISMPMVVRCRKSGDRFKPLGMNGHSMKVSDLMINLKLPRRARRSWPLVCSGADILWIPGYRQSHLVQVKPGSRLVVHLFLSKITST